MTRWLMLMALCFPLAAAAEPNVTLPQGWKSVLEDAHRRGEGAGFLAMAIDPAGLGKGQPPAMNARAFSCSGPIDRSTVALLARRIRSSITGRSPQTTVTLRGRDLIEIGGVKVARIELLTRNGRLESQKLSYMIPGGESCVLLTFSAQPAVFERYRALFEKSARATTGVAAPPPVRRAPRPALRGALKGAILGAIAGGLLALVGWLRRRRAGSSEGSQDNPD